MPFSGLPTQLDMGLLGNVPSSSLGSFKHVPQDMHTFLKNEAHWGKKKDIQRNFKFASFQRCECYFQSAQQCAGLCTTSAAVFNTEPFKHRTAPVYAAPHRMHRDCNERSCQTTNTPRSIRKLEQCKRTANERQCIQTVIRSIIQLSIK